MPVGYQGKTIHIEPPIGALRELFLSSTVRDLEKYRRGVKTALDRAQISCFLSEDWSGGYDETVQKCQDRLNAADGYIGIFGFWYGSIPPRSDRSITHLEFTWARERWCRLARPPVAVFMPTPASQAERELKAAAERLLEQNQVPADFHRTRLEKFLDEVRNPRDQWRTIQFFKDRHDLSQCVLIAALNWQGMTLLDAAQRKLKVNRKGSGGAVKDARLGMLGRAPQINAVETLLAELEARRGIPAAALLVHGHLDAGHRALLLHLGQMKAVRRELEEVVPGILPPGTMGLKNLVQWVGQALGVLETGRGVDTPGELAELVAEELEHGPLCFLLDEVHRLAGGVEAFHTSFWVPFYERLKTLVARRPAERPEAHRLVAIVADHTGRSGDWRDHVWPYRDDPNEIDFSRLLELPVMTNFKESDVIKWLTALEVPDNPKGHHAAIAARVLKNPVGDSDGTPRRVFDRIRDEILWPEGDKR